MVKKILLADVCLSNRLILLLRQRDITVLEAKAIRDISAKFIPRNAKRPWGDQDILEFVRRKDFILITADRALARRYEYGILVSANCKKSADIQLAQALAQYEQIRGGNQLRHLRHGSYPDRHGDRGHFIDAFGRAVFVPPFEG